MIAYALFAVFVLGWALGVDLALKVKREVWEYFGLALLVLVWPFTVIMAIAMWQTWSSKP
jgi:hypothetical protein